MSADTPQDGIGVATHIAVLGAGPSGIFATAELLKRPELSWMSTTGCRPRSDWSGMAWHPTITRSNLWPAACPRSSSTAAAGSSATLRSAST
jgi:hypothetical protein